MPSPSPRSSADTPTSGRSRRRAGSRRPCRPACRSRRRGPASSTRPTSPRARRAAKQAPCSPATSPARRRAAGVVAVVGAELVVLDRGGVERHDCRHRLTVSGDRIAGTWVWTNMASSGPPGADGGSPGGRATRRAPSSCRSRAAGRPALDLEGDRREHGVDRLVGADEVLQVVAVGDVPEGLLEHEADTWPQRPSGVLIFEQRQHAATGTELVRHAPVVGEVVQGAQRLLGERAEAQRGSCRERCPSGRRSSRGAAGRVAHVRVNARTRRWRPWNSVAIESSSHGARGRGRR